MGHHKRNWTKEEEDALLNGILKHGTGKWSNILRDPEFAPFLNTRSNIDIKDKWRNLSIGSSHEISEKPRAPKEKANASASTKKNVSRYIQMIYEVLSTTNDSNGCDFRTIVNFIEQRHEVPQKFRKQMSSRLGRLVAGGKIEKVQNLYKLNKDYSISVTTPPTLEEKDVAPHTTEGLMPAGERVEEEDVGQRISPPYTTGGLMPIDAAKAAAFKVTEAEIKSLIAAEAVKEAEKTARIAQDTDSMLRIIKEMYEKCSRGEIITLA